MGRDLLTRDAVAAAFSVTDHGVIRSPGKFEGEPWWAVALWEESLLGLADETLDEDEGGPTDLFTVDEEMIAVLGLPAKWLGLSVGVYVDEQDFVRVLCPLAIATVTNR